MPDSLTVAISVAKVEAQALRDAAVALWNGEGPDVTAGADDAVACWLTERAEAIEARI